jgi:hypothetical protein
LMALMLRRPGAYSGDVINAVADALPQLMAVPLTLNRPTTPYIIRQRTFIR